MICPKQLAFEGFPRRVRIRRRDLMLDTKQVAKNIGIPLPDYLKIESGEDTPSRRILIRLSMELRASERWLLQGGY